MREKIDVKYGKNLLGLLVIWDPQAICHTDYWKFFCCRGKLVAGIPVPMAPAHMSCRDW